MSVLLKALRNICKKVIYFSPFSIRSCGHDSYILRPRRINGAECIQIGDRTTIHKHSWLEAITEYAGEKFAPRIVFGDDVYVGQYACIVAVEGIVIEDGCVLSEHVYISDSGHGFEPGAGLIMKQKLFHKGEIHIGAHSFLGYRASIMPGVTLGEHCIVGAHSVLTKSFPAYSMVAGVPARLIKTYSVEEKQWVPAEDAIAKYKS